METSRGQCARHGRGSWRWKAVLGLAMASPPFCLGLASGQHYTSAPLAPVMGVHAFHAGCSCPGCTSFRDQCERGVAPPVIIDHDGGDWAPDSPYGVAPGSPAASDTLSSPGASPEQRPTDSAVPSSPLDAGSPVPDSGMDFGAGMPDASGLSASPSTSGQLASAFGGSAGGFGAPSMMGDFFGGGYQMLVVSGGNGSTVRTPVSIPIAGGDRRRKLADHTSPFPQNRVTFSYNHYRNAVADIYGEDQHVNRYMFGLERAFFNYLASVDLRIPFAGGVSSTQSFNNPDTLGTEFGNISLTLKGLLMRSPRAAVSTGLTMIFPTADDVVLSGLPGFFSDVTFDSGSVHLAPFLATWYAPTPRLFHQFFVQTDFDTGGYEVVFDNQTRGTLQEQSLLYLDYSLGWWLYRNPYAFVKGIAPMFEVHYTTTMQDADPGPLPGVIVENRRDIYNVMGGLNLQVGRATTVRFGGGSPLRGSSNREFDAEFALQVTRFY